MKRTFIAVCVALFAAGSVRADDKDAQPVTVPFELLKTRHMVVQVKINGQGPFRMIFDTGAPVTLLNNKTALATGVIQKPGEGLAVLLSGKSLPKLKNLEVGTLAAKDLPVMVMDHPLVNLMAKHLNQQIEGIVGLSFFGRYRMTIDYEKKQMTFVATGYQPADMMSRLMTMLTSGKQERKILTPAGQWGFSVEKKKDDTEAGVNVKAVLDGGAAALAKLQAGDRLLTLDGRWTDSVDDVYRAAGHVRPGTMARLLIRRDGKEMELTVNVKPGL